MSVVTSRGVFLTGATGFIGSAVLERLVASGKSGIVCLVRSPEEARQSHSGGVRYVRGDINDSSTYSDALAECDAVVHMAAATGTARESELRRVNVDGTRELLAACKRAGIKHFVFMSSIAAAADDSIDYPYARTKIDAESLVRDSGLEHTIVRPTIVLSERGGNWTMLRKLACLPVVPLFGGGTARVQPVDLADVARGVELILDGIAKGTAMIEIGGPEVLTFADFLRRIRKACGRAGSPFVAVPIGPMAALLKVARKLFGESFPISAGQLAPFVCDGVAAANPVHEQLRAKMPPLDELLASIAHRRNPAEDMDPRRECLVFTRYLTGRDPDGYVIEQYVRMQQAVLSNEAAALPVDHALLAWASAGTYRARIADAYARLFRPRGLLRRKLILLFAILENSHAFHRDFTSGGSGSRTLAVLRIGTSVLTFAAALVLGVLVFAPRQLLSGAAGAAGAAE